MYFYVKQSFYTVNLHMKIKEVCYSCAYFDTSLPKGKAYKCFTDSCPVRKLGSAKVNALLRAYKKENKK